MKAACTVREGAVGKGLATEPRLPPTSLRHGGTFTRWCASKAEEAGCTVVKVSPRNTTQICSGCGVLVPKGLSVRWHSCPECGTELDRDENAARVILQRYLHPKTPPIVKREKKLRTPKKTKAGAGSVPQPLGEEPASLGDCRSLRL